MEERQEKRVAKMPSSVAGDFGLGGRREIWSTQCQGGSLDRSSLESACTRPRAGCCPSCCARFRRRTGR
eukprot:1238717-Pleurochrysis_carterae.AAC.1